MGTGAWGKRMDLRAALRVLSRITIVAGVLTQAGCTYPGIRVRDIPEPTVRTNWARAGIADQRKAFAEVFCRHLALEHPPSAASCDHWLWGAAPVDAAERTDSGPVLLATRSLIVIPGIFGECVAPWVTPFSNDYATLERLGYRVHVVDVTGRGSSRLNADIIHSTLSDPALSLDGAVVVAYSKGVTDFMLAASRPEALAWKNRLSAFISVAGTANGSPAANHGAALYASLLKRAPFSTCPKSDGGGVDSLTYAQARAAADYFAASQVPFATYSVVAVAHGRPVNPVLDGFYRLLSRIDERNDGQVIVEDAVVQGSTVLGVFRADHWSIALPFEDSRAPLMKPLAVNNHFPRGALIRAVLEFAAPLASPPTQPKE